MIKRRLLSYDIPQLTKVFKKDFPQLVTMAEESESAALFKEALRSFVFSRIDKTVGGSNMGNAVAKRILLLIEHDGMMVFELSTGEEMPVRTITCLWQFLAGKLEEDVSPDFFIDLYWAIRIAGEAGGNRSGPFACQTADEPLADRAGRGGDGDPLLQQGADHCRVDT